MPEKCAELSESLQNQNQYRESRGAVRPAFGTDSAFALKYYSPLLEFVSGLCPPKGARLLDVGCGNGWSTFAFARAGYEAAGIDLSPKAFEPPSHPHCELLEGSATEIPFAPDSFDLVVCYQCLEHVPAPRRALDEMVRVCRPNGIVAVVGPNLVSPIYGLRYVARPSSWPSLRLRRRMGMPKHPFGNTLPEVFAVALLRTVQLVVKLVRPSPQFTMREPDTEPPFHSDNDACYLCNPTDLIAYFKGQGFRIERRGKPGRPPLSYLLAAGTWVAARKPATRSTEPV